jgi:SHS2 domain-containing protein
MPQLLTTEGFLEIPHRADVALKVWSSDLNGLFIQAARGMYSLMGFGERHGCNISRSVGLSESDSVTLLIRFLNELIYDVQLGSVVYEELKIQILQNRLDGELKGKKTTGFVREIKAATYHECKILQTTAGYETMIVFDI